MNVIRLFRLMLFCKAVYRSALSCILYPGLRILAEDDMNDLKEFAIVIRLLGTNVVKLSGIT